MKQMYILYIGIEKNLNNRSKELASYLVSLLSIRYRVDLVGDLFNDQSQELRRCYDLIIVHNSFTLVHYKKLLKQYVKCPIFFVATTKNINSYIAPFENLFGVLDMSDISSSVWGIPEELQLRLNYPVEKLGNYYCYEQQPELCQIVYCPTGNSIQENDLKLLTLLQRTNVLLTIVSDEYQFLKNALLPFVKIVSRLSWYSVYKKAHLIIASGSDAVRAMALCKPCVVLGDYGLGGMVTPANYDLLKSVCFEGRKGGYFGEIIPLNLLEIEIRKTFVCNQEDSVLDIKKRVANDYNKKDFDKKFLQEIERIISLSALMKQDRKKYLLKARLSSLFALDEVDGKQYLLRGMNYFGELDPEMVELLKQCDGTSSIYDLIQRNGYDNKDAGILWANLYELWKEKLILFIP